MWGRFKGKFIGDAAFYERVIRLVIPMIIQNLITNGVSLLDNIMVGQIGTEQMSGVAIVNQLMFVFNITIFGGVSGPGIFGAQFYGKGDHEGQKQTFRFRLLECFAITLIALFLFHNFDTELISLYLKDSGGAGDIALTMYYGKQYLAVMIFSLFPFALGQTYASVIRECGETVVPMISSFSAVGINLVLDYGLIFGKFGLPQMGVQGAAVATVVAKTIEALVVVIWAHRNTQKNKYIIGLFKGFAISKSLLMQMIVKGLPLLVNEFLWAAGVATISQCYAYRGLEVVAAQNIASTMNNLFSVIYIQLGACIAIIVGQALGAGKLDEAKDLDTKLIFFSVTSCVVVGALMLPVARVFPSIYNTDQSIKTLATYFITIQALVMPLWSFAHCAYFTLRSGGNTWTTFIFDSLYTWIFMIPLAFCLTRFTSVPIRPLFAIVSFSDIVKCIIGFIFIRSGTWLQNLVEND